jgi:hypothetical protein
MIVDFVIYVGLSILSAWMLGRSYRRHKRLRWDVSENARWEQLRRKR